MPGIRNAKPHPAFVEGAVARLVQKAIHAEEYALAVELADILDHLEAEREELRAPCLRVHHRARPGGFRW